MNKVRFILFAIGIFLLALVSFRVSEFKFFPREYRFASERYFVLDAVGVVSGLRRFTSNIAWIQLLLYYGRREEEEHGIGCPHGCPHWDGGLYPHFLEYAQRVIRLDPYFCAAYIYSAASLAWNLNRVDEALLIIDEGIENSEFFPPLVELYIHKAAIIYKMLGKYHEMVRSLESAIKLPHCPTLVKSILANIYEKQGEYEKAIMVWKNILETTNDEFELERARKKIEKLLATVTH